jgi:outer membrane immunogenic protein
MGVERMRHGVWAAAALVVGAPLAGGIPVALAADLPVKAPVYQPILAYNWTGFYAGLNGGYGWANGSNIELLTNDVTLFNFGDSTSPSRGTIGDAKARGWFGGGQIGYNYQFASNWLAGIETDIQYSDINQTLTGRFSNPSGAFPIDGTANLDLKWFGTLRGRLGFVQNNWLLYVTGGLAYGEVDYSLAASEQAGAGLFRTSMSSSSTKTGYVLGGGFEYAFSPNLSTKLEYQYIDLGKINADAPVTLIATGAPTGEIARSADIAVQVHTVRVGLNYRFGSR